MLFVTGRRVVPGQRGSSGRSGCAGQTEGAGRGRTGDGLDAVVWCEERSHRGRPHRLTPDVFVTRYPALRRVPMGPDRVYNIVN